MSRSAWAVWIGATGAFLLLQSAADVAVVLDEGRVGTMLDLDRSNGLPDLVSTVVLAAVAVGATLIARSDRGRGRFVAIAIAISWSP